MRLLVANANTSDSITRLLAEVAGAAASPGTEILQATGPFGAAILSSRADNAVGHHAIIAAVAEQAGTFDAVLVAVSMDTAVPALREALAVPVVGMTEASLLMACLLGGKFGLVTFSKRSTAPYRELVESYGLERRLAGIRTIDMSFARVFEDRATTHGAIVKAGQRLVDDCGAEAIIPIGAAAAGVAPRIQPRLPVPVVDGVACGVLLCEALVRLNAAKPTAGSYGRLAGNVYKGLTPALGQLLGGKGGG